MDRRMTSLVCCLLTIPSERTVKRDRQTERQRQTEGDKDDSSLSRRLFPVVA